MHRFPKNSEPILFNISTLNTRTIRNYNTKRPTVYSKWDRTEEYSVEYYISILEEMRTTYLDIYVHELIPLGLVGEREK